MTSYDRPTACSKVGLVRWPAQTLRRAELAEIGVPRLLIVDNGAEPPLVHDGEDWCWVSADERDVATRLSHLHMTTRVDEAANHAISGPDHLDLLAFLAGPAGPA